MKIKSLQLKNFKRFTDLTIQDIPESAKLVLLIGSNGSGKSSVFDGFERISSLTIDKGLSQYIRNIDYYSKNKTNDYNIQITASEGMVFDNLNFSNLPLLNSFYGRTSFRQIPRLTRTGLGNSPFDIEKNTDRPLSFIDRDQRFENDLEHIFGRLLKEYFISKDKSEIAELVIEPINESFVKIFGSENGTVLTLTEIIPPLEGKIAEISFKKGNSTFHYHYLSAGEKEVFNILINLVARREYYKDTIYFFDEIDLHLNTRLQYAFLKEIVENWLPPTCQFWTASHSLGFIQYATDYEKGCIIDFDDLDFDKPQVLIPKKKDDFEVFEIAVSKAFIDQVVQGRKIIFSENLDTPFYNDLNIPNTFFFVAIDKMDVFHKAKNHRQFGLIDRDYLADDEVESIKRDYPNLYILPYYSFENLLYHPDNLEEYYKNVNRPYDKQSYIQHTVKSKNDNKDTMLLGMQQARGGYLFYKENENSKKLKAFRENSKGLVDLLKSDDIETFYKIFPVKDYGKEIQERQNLSASELSKTNWFKTQKENTFK